MKVFLNMVGCRLNQAEIERLALSLTENGVEVVSDPKEADEIVINTCCVTAKASADSRKMLRHHKTRFPNAHIIGTGCWVTISKDKLAEKAEMLDRAYDNSQKEQILLDIIGKTAPDQIGNSQSRPNLGSRNRTRGFVKVQDGCDNRCAYCLTQIARGPSVSSSPESVVGYALKLQNLGVKEIVLTGVQLGSWGKDLSPKQSLADLVQMLLNQTQLPRIRLSSIEPWDVNAQLIELFGNPRLCSHMHIPLQSGSDEILRMMNRPVNKARFEKMLGSIRDVNPDMAITTDVICGFPGETDELFIESINFIKKCQFSGGHVFPFSGLRGTSAFDLAEQIQNSIRRERTTKVRQVLDEARETHVSRRLGQKAQVLFENLIQLGDLTYWQGWSEDFLKVFVQSKDNLHNKIISVLLNDRKKTGEIYATVLSQAGTEDAP